MSDGFLLLNKKLIIKRANDSYLEMMGLTKEHCLGKSLWDLCPDDPRFNYPEAVRKSLNEKLTCQFLDFIPKIDLWVDATVYPFEDGLAIVFKNVTEKIAETERIKESELQLKAIFNSTDDIFIVINPDLRIVSYNINASASDKTSIGFDLKIGESIMSYQRFSKVEFKKVLQRVTSGEIVQFEREFIVPDQSKLWFDVKMTPIYNEQKEFLGISIYVRDITERNKTSESIKKSEVTLRAVLDSMEEANVLIDPNYKIQSFNKMAAVGVKRFYQTSISIGDSIFDYTQPQVQEGFIQNFQKALSGEFITIIREITFPNKESVWMSSKYHPVKNDDGQIIGVSFSTADISRQKRNELRIFSQNERLREIAHLQSHQMRRPIATILGLLQLIDKTKLDRGNKKYFDFLENEAKSVDRIIHEIVAQTSEIEIKEQQDQ